VSISSNLATNLAGNEASALAGGGFQTPAQTFGVDPAAGLRALWDVRAGAVTAGSWTDQITGRVMPLAAGNPPLAADGDNFRRVPVYVYDGVDDAHAYNGTGNAMGTTGQPFYMWCVGRFVIATTGLMFRGLNGASSTFIEVNATTGASRALWQGNPFSASFPSPQAGGTLIEIYSDATNANLRVNGTVVGIFAGGVAFPVDFERLSVGGVGGSFAQCMVAQYGIANVMAKPAQLAAQLAYSRAVWGTP
jgi:hypothetical protein